MNITLAAHSGLLGVEVETVARHEVSRVAVETPTGDYELWVCPATGRLNIQSQAPNSLVVLPQVTNCIQLQGDKPL